MSARAKWINLVRSSSWMRGRPTLQVTSFACALNSKLQAPSTSDPLSELGYLRCLAGWLQSVVDFAPPTVTVPGLAQDVKQKHTALPRTASRNNTISHGVHNHTPQLRSDSADRCSHESNDNSGPKQYHRQSQRYSRLPRAGCCSHGAFRKRKPQSHPWILTHQELLTTPVGLAEPICLLSHEC